MKFVLNKQRGSTINHPSVGKLKGGVAYEVTEHQANMMKHIINVIVFDEVVLKEKEIVTKDDNDKQ
ncbi:hypothetical protein CMI37_29195 [Candidatus Pacearchaeota archaeon]|jgi:hypothetical protein|nr:hypothetical protein [Candidatus Pacearchaeota archaeon]|tara:strand:- start:9150 stop:9347 length:198 start_codon:yes stop_codon:yes gene_type:complete